MGMRALRLAFFAWMVALLVWVWGVQRPLSGASLFRLLEHGAVLGVVGGTGVVGWAVGHGLSRRRFWPPMPLWAQGLYRLFLGLLVWSWLGLALSVGGWLSRGLLTGLWAVAVVVGGLYLLRHRDDAVLEFRALLSGLPQGWWLFAGLTLVLALLPPTSFDALMYHLALPERLLRWGGIRPEPVAHFWNPAFVEYVYLWPVALGMDRAARVLHSLWALGAVLWVFHWAQEVFGVFPARDSLWVLLSMPSLPLVASWAYTDAALVFYTVAALYALTQAWVTGSKGWFLLAGMAAGMAPSIKYTGLFLPAAGGISLLWALRREGRALIKGVGSFVGSVLFVAAPWYVRNALYMGNPIYPFFFGGRGWDAFLQEWYGRGGSGLGLDLWRWVFFPFQAVAGLGDLTYVDGRIGPWWLILAPAVVVWLPRWWRHPRRRKPLAITLVFGCIGLAVWLYGVAWSRLLWQARLLLPVLFPLALWMGAAVHGLRVLDGREALSLRRVTRGLLVLSVGLVLLEHGVSFVRQNGPAYLLGEVNRWDFYRDQAPLYVEYLNLLSQAPEDARIYALFEARTYLAPREVMPDTLLAHLPHDLARYGSVERMVKAWRNQGYTHVVVFHAGAELLFQEDPGTYTRKQRQALSQLENLLTRVARSPSGAYTLYALMPGR